MKNLITLLLLLMSFPALAVEVNALIRPNTIDGPGWDVETQFNCEGPMNIDFTNGLSIEYTLESCAQIFNHDFSKVTEVPDIPFIVDGQELSISHLTGSTATVMDMILFSESSEDIFCEWARDHDTGTGVFLPTPNCQDLIVYDGNDNSDTLIPNCVAQPGILSKLCTGPNTVKGHTIYSQRLLWKDRGTKKELVGMIQVTSINQMIGSNLGPYKNLIVAVSRIPGNFNTSESCRDITASENSDVAVIQADSQLALDNPGKFCELEVGTLYYVNARFDGGLSEQCGVDANCRYDVVERLPDI